MEKIMLAQKPEKNRLLTGRFRAGKSGNPNGRPVGSQNKFTTLKAAFIGAFEELGGVGNLVEWARGHQTEFYKILARLLPREIHADLNSEFSLIDALREMDERELKRMSEE